MLGPPRPGRTVVLTGDTAPAASVLEVAHEADLLVHEATFAEEERERAPTRPPLDRCRRCRARARAAGVRMLALTHLSNRYFGPEIAREAREVFPETVVPRDFDIIDVRFQERGGPRLVKGGATATRERRLEPHDEGMVQVAVAGDLAEAEEIQAILHVGGDPVGASPGRGAAPGGTR